MIEMKNLHDMKNHEPTCPEREPHDMNIHEPTCHDMKTNHHDMENHEPTCHEKTWREKS